MQATVGLEPAIGDPAKIDLDLLTHAVQTSIEDWNTGHFPDLKEERDLKIKDKEVKDASESKLWFFKKWFSRSD